MVSVLSVIYGSWNRNHSNQSRATGRRRIPLSTAKTGNLLKMATWYDIMWKMTLASDDETAYPIVTRSRRAKGRLSYSKPQNPRVSKSHKSFSRIHIVLRSGGHSYQMKSVGTKPSAGLVKWVSSWLQDVAEKPTGKRVQNADLIP
jgi:hypothetical protein